MPRVHSHFHCILWLCLGKLLKIQRNIVTERKKKITEKITSENEITGQKENGISVADVVTQFEKTKVRHRVGRMHKYFFPIFSMRIIFYFITLKKGGYTPHTTITTTVIFLNNVLYYEIIISHIFIY